MNQYYPNLFKPLKVKKTVFRNRIFSAPGGMKSFTDHNHLTERVIDYQAHKAAGGRGCCYAGRLYCASYRCCGMESKDEYI